MSLLPIITAPDPRLKVVSEAVPEVTEELRILMDDMLETMYAAPGIGLAAIQVGVPKRVIAIHITADDLQPEPLFLVNPVILEHSDTLCVTEEGCLSLPEQFSDVERPDHIRLTYLDYHGNEIEDEADGVLATCIQHEMDHLEGILFIDHISRVKRQMILRKLQRAKRQELRETA